MSKERLLSLLLSLFHISYAQPTLIQVHRKSKQINKYIKVFGFHLIDLKRRKKVRKENINSHYLFDQGTTCVIYFMSKS